MSQVKVSTEAVAAAAQTTAGLAADFDKRITALHDLVTRTIGSSWRGAAAEAFRADFQQWFDGAGRLHEALVDASDLLAQSAVVYDETERSVTQASSDSSVDTGAAS